jgi:hypothetical protein
MRRPALALLALALASSAAGCSSPCQDLGERICNCLAEGQVRTNCKTEVKNRVKVANPSAQEEDVCSAALDTCPDPGSEPHACELLNTCQGKVACGLAIEPPEGCPSDAAP